MRQLMLYLLASLLFKSSGYAHNKYWYIAVHVDDCTSCLAEIPRITSLSSAIPATLIFPKSEWSDSAAWMEKFFLQDFKGKIVFDDSMYHKFALKHELQQSSVTLWNEENKTSLSVPLSNIAFPTFPLNRLLSNTDTFRFTDEVLNTSTYFKTSARYFYLYNQRKGTINTFNRLTGNYVGELRVTDSLAEEAYSIKYGKKSGPQLFRDIKQYIRRNKIVGAYNQFVAFKTINDTLYTLAAHPTFVDTLNTCTLQRDTMILVFYALAKSSHNNTYNVCAIETYLDARHWHDPKMKRSLYRNPEDAYFITREYLIKNPGLAMGLIGTYIMANGDNYAIADFKEKGKGNMVFDQYFERLPLTYVKNAIGYNYINNYIQDRNYYCFQLDDTLRAINGDRPDIPLDFIPKQQSMRHQTTISDFYINGSHLYLLVNEAGSATDTYYYKYDLKEKKLLKKQQYNMKSLPYTFNFPSIDKFDPDYLLYEISSKELVRIKALN